MLAGIIDLTDAPIAHWVAALLDDPAQLPALVRAALKDNPGEQPILMKRWRLSV
jgi:hypothetical protein